MKSSYEENYKALQTINLEVDKLKETIISEINGVDNNESNDTSIKWYR